jgi:dihydropteroate synthase
MRPRFQWNLGHRSLVLGERTLVMGIVNVTPDSFSDGGRYLDPDAAIAHGLALLDEGADILDMGGESTRPGVPVDSPLSPDRQQSVSAQQEIDRVLPVLEGLRRARPEAIFSIDTYKSTVAQAALDAGAEIVNDVSGLSWDAQMASLLAGRPCGVVLMHTRGTPAEWRELPPLGDPVAVVIGELGLRAAHALEAGIGRDSLVVDPGFGFGKRGEENYALLARLAEFHSLGLPLLAGLSRKRFLRQTLDRRLAAITGGQQSGSANAEPAQVNSTEQQDVATLAGTVAATLAGAHIVRVHAVRAAVEALAIADATVAAGK